MTVAPLAKAIPDVVSRTPHANSDFGRGVERLLGELVGELRGVLARDHCRALTRGETDTIRRPTSVEVLAPAPQIERMSIMVIGDVMWREHDGIKTAARCSITGLPVEAAKRAILSEPPLSSTLMRKPGNGRG